MNRNSDGWIEVYEQKGALWIHDGNPKRPHVVLTEGNHSNGFFNSRLVIADVPLLEQAAADLLDLLTDDGAFSSRMHNVDVVVGPETGATKLAELISTRIRIVTRGAVQCGCASPAKHEENGVKSMVFNDEDLNMLSGKLVLLGDDVITTAGSVERTAQAVIAAGGVVLPYILALVNRSGMEEANGKKIIALIDRHMPTWKPDECPLCEQGSEALRPPKDPINWAKLNAIY